MAQRPFRSPHHAVVSDAGLVGRESPPSPGEISLANNGVFFLDELPEFNRQTLEVVRQPLEDRVVTISQALRSTTFSADFISVAALNPCHAAIGQILAELAIALRRRSGAAWGE